ncbi:MAG: aldose epimerase family protein [Roseinatronobacter sp.]
MHEPEIFGHLPDGRAVHRVWISGGGLRASVLTIGAILQDLRLDGVDHPLILGAETLPPYLGPMNYFGAIVGRYANRLRDARVHAGGRDWALDRNWLGAHILHGGQGGVSTLLWDIAERTENSVTLTLTSPHGDMGFPGGLQITARIALEPDCAMRVEITATTDAETPCNLCQHPYFILDDTGSIVDHAFQIAAESYLPADEATLPTGEIAPVAGTAFDFRTARALGRQEIDHNFCLSDARAPLRPVAQLRSATLAMDLETTEPGLQVFTAPSFPEQGHPGLEGRLYRPFAGIALEAQSWPDAPNQPHFPPAMLQPGAVYRSLTRYRFSRLQGQDQ